jgi:hypothetical protein
LTARLLESFSRAMVALLDVELVNGSD